MGDIIDFDEIKQIQQAVEEQVEIEKLDYENSQTTAPKYISSADILYALDANEDGDARLLVQLCKGKYCYDHAEGNWYRFNGNHWEQDAVNNAIKAIDQVVETYGQEVLNQTTIRIQATAQADTPKQTNAKKLEDNLLKRISVLRTLHRKQHILQLASSGSDSLGITGNEWDCNPWLLACSNGVIDLKSGHFREGRPDDYIKTAAPTEWLGLDEPAPQWIIFQKEIFEGNQEVVDFVHRLLGYAAIGQVLEHIFPIFWGQGWNGKGTTLETICHVLGELAGPFPSASIMEQQFTRSGSAPSPELMKLRGRRVTWSSETGKNRKLNLEKVKWLVGGDSITARQVFGKRQVEFSPTHTLFLLTNYKPHLNADDYAAWHRIYLIPFRLSFVDDPKQPNERQKDKDLKDKLKQEAAGILAWLVRGCLLYQQEGLNPPAIVKDATQEYQNEEDIYGQFLDDCCIQTPHAFVKASNFYQAYVDWCIQNNHKYENSTNFGLDMTKRFVKKTRNGSKFYLGVGLKEQSEPQEDESMARDEEPIFP